MCLNIRRRMCTWHDLHPPSLAGFFLPLPCSAKRLARRGSDSSPRIDPAGIPIFRLCTSMRSRAALGLLVRARAPPIAGTCGGHPRASEIWRLFGSPGPAVPAAGAAHFPVTCNLHTRALRKNMHIFVCAGVHMRKERFHAVHAQHTLTPS